MGYLQDFSNLHDPLGRASSLERPNPVSYSDDDDTLHLAVKHNIALIILHLYKQLNRLKRLTFTAGYSNATTYYDAYWLIAKFLSLYDYDNYLQFADVQVTDGLDII